MFLYYQMFYSCLMIALSMKLESQQFCSTYESIKTVKPRPNALDISLDNARHFVESNVESVWPPCRGLLSLVERCRDKFEQVQNCRVVTLDISIVSSVVEGCRVRLARLSTFCSTFANQRMRNMQYFEHNLYPAFFSFEPLSFPFLHFSRLRE